MKIEKEIEKEIVQKIERKRHRERKKARKKERWEREMNGRGIEWEKIRRERSREREKKLHLYVQKCERERAGRRKGEKYNNKGSDWKIQLKILIQKEEFEKNITINSKWVGSHTISL